MEETEPEVAAGCRHYARHCEVLAECCQNWVDCRLCHNEKFEDHEIDRHAIRKMRCNECHTVQPCAQECASCGRCMGAYFCKVCNLFDDGGIEKQFFHCDGCGICRVGGRENFYHCDKCCGCYPHSLESKHKCLQDSMHRECPICLDVTFESLETLAVLPCGHVMHTSCYKEFIRYGNIECPTCRTMMFSEDELIRAGGEAAEGESDDDEADDEEGDDDEEMDDDEAHEDDEVDGEEDSGSDADGSDADVDDDNAQADEQQRVDAPRGEEP